MLGLGRYPSCVPLTKLSNAHTILEEATRSGNLMEAGDAEASDLSWRSPGAQHSCWEILVSTPVAQLGIECESPGDKLERSSLSGYRG